MQIFVTYSTFMPALPANLKPGMLKVDAQPYCTSPGHCSNGNGIFEPEETVIVEPSWEYTGGTPQSFTNHAGSWSGPQDGTQYIIVRDKADYAVTSAGSNIMHCDPASDCYILALDPQDVPHRDAWLSETFANGSIYTWTIHLGKSFTDVPVDSPFYRDVETMLHHGLTSGCGGLQFCPDSNLTRWELAIMLARAMAGGDDNIPNSGSISIPNVGIANYNCSSVSPSSLFQDIQPTDFYCKYVHYLFKYDVTSGCSTTPRNFCPNSSVSRLELAALVARALNYADNNILMKYTDPATNLSYDCTPGSAGNLQFNDIQKGNTFCRHVYYLWARNAVNGCASNSFCPSLLATRIQIAKVLISAFDIDLYTPLSQHVAGPSAAPPCRKWGNPNDNRSTHLSWGGYDLLPVPENTNICGIVGAIRNYDAECFRTFVNHCEKVGTNNSCIFPYQKNSGNGYDLRYWNENGSNGQDWYWNGRVKNLMGCSGCGTNGNFKKAVFTIGDSYQCTHGWTGPWCNNNNDYSQFHANQADPWYCSELEGTNCSGQINIPDDWIQNWPTSTCTDCWCRWIKCQYRKLAAKFKGYGADVFEIYNEAAISDANKDNIIQAHKELIQAIKSDYSTAKIQISIDPPQRIQYTPVFSYVWDQLIAFTDYWSIHGLWPDEESGIPTWMSSPINGSLEKKLELSTDGQLCNIPSFFPDTNPNHCVHYLAAGLFLNVFQDSDDLHFESDSVPLSWWSEPQMELIRNTCENVESGKLFVSNSMDAPFINDHLNVCSGSKVFAFWDTSSFAANTSCTITPPSGWTGRSGHKINQDSPDGWIPPAGSSTLTLTCGGTQLDSIAINASTCSADINSNKTIVAPGDDYWISWHSGCASLCNVKKNSSQWQQALQGNVHELADGTGSITYDIYCTCPGVSQQAHDSVIVNIQYPSPTGDLRADPDCNAPPPHISNYIDAESGIPYCIFWKSEYSNHCSIDKDNQANWAICDSTSTCGSGSKNDVYLITDNTVEVTKTYTLNCSGPGGNSLPSIVRVRIWNSLACHWGCLPGETCIEGLCR